MDQVQVFGIVVCLLGFQRTAIDEVITRPVLTSDASKGHAFTFSPIVIVYRMIITRTQTASRYIALLFSISQEFDISHVCPPPPCEVGSASRPCAPARVTTLVKAAVHWVRVSAFSAESSPNLTWTAMGLRADSVRRLSVRAEPLTN